MESVRDFFVNYVGKPLYANDISIRSLHITDSMGESEPGAFGGVTAGRVARSVGDTFTLGIFNFSGIKTHSTNLDTYLIAPLRRMAQFTVVPLLNGGLKFVYNVFAFIGNFFRMIAHVGERNKMKACLGFMGTNLVEMVRNAIRAIPVVGHGLTKLASSVGRIPFVADLIEKKAEFGKEAFAPDEGSEPAKEVEHLEEITYKALQMISPRRNRN